VQAPDRRVALLWAVGDDDSFVIDRIATALDGLVGAALGAGHVSARQALALKRLSDRCSVVLASRCGAGPVLTNTYGGAGSESDLTSAGLVPAGRLDPVKCRLRLLFGLSSGVRVADLFPVG
jgi:L-asparaginase